ncbi:MAG: sigma-54 dependent transcriptional regulator [Pseudomonadota bacterium]|nr:sigma-54 dependent transcriptional regulator [Pseudomonadota bacterium]
MPPDICLIEDDPIMGESLRERLVLEGFTVDWCESGTHALELLKRRDYDAVVSDIRLPDIPGDELFRRMVSDPETRMPPTVFITGYGTVESAVELLKLGAADYLTKPLDPRALVQKLRELCREHRPTANGQEPLGLSPAMQRLAAKLPAIARHVETPVLIAGESGSGKEVVAHRIHDLTDVDQPFVAVNCAAVPENLIEAELFGHEKGAFTGAGRSHRGLFEQADGGLLFLDEIGDMPLPMQAKLLRAIQERVITRIGADEPVSVRFRLVCATHQDLADLVRAGRFREDLYYRINVIQLLVPPLRERPEDILWLAERFVAKHAEVYPAERKRLGNSARKALLAHRWPGNVRELQHAVERACIMAPGPIIEAPDLFPEGQIGPRPRDPSLGAVREANEREYILRALESHGWRMAETASTLGISRKTLWQKMKRMDIQRP